MTRNINSEITLGELAARFPFTVPVLNRYKLDYCCGGKDSLGEAAGRSDLDLSLLLHELDGEIENAETAGIKIRDWSVEPVPEIIKHILNTHHLFMKDSLSELNTLLVRVLNTHFQNDSEILLEVHKLFGLLKTDLEAHLAKEETRLFPLILEYDRTEDPDLKRRILLYLEEAEGEHEEAGRLFEKLAVITEDYRAPEHACGSWRRAYSLLDDLEKDTFNHIHLENTVLFGKVK